MRFVIAYFAAALAVIASAPIAHAFPPPGAPTTTNPGLLTGSGAGSEAKINRVLRIGSETVTVEAGAKSVDVARQLEKHNLQFYVNTEIGSLTAGSAACAGTKDASFPGEYGQVGSYVTGVKMVLPNGSLLEVTDDDPVLMQKVRSSYGTFAVVYEVTYRVRQLLPMAVYHETYTLEDFVAQLDELKGLGESMMYYIFPFADRITIEFRRYNPGASGSPNRSAWALRNYLWGTAGPRFAHDIEAKIPFPKIRYEVIDGFNALIRFKLEHLIRADYTLPPGQIIDYPPVSDNSGYTFSLFAFPEAEYGRVLIEFAAFVRDHYDQKDYRSNLPCVGYRITQDQKALLSYSYDGPVMTIDPVSTGNNGWKEFLAAYNQFCSDRGGSPLLNQTYGLTPAIAKKAFGDRLATFKQARRDFDPDNRLLNEYFRALLS